MIEHDFYLNRSCFYTIIKITNTICIVGTSADIRKQSVVFGLIVLIIFVQKSFTKLVGPQLTAMHSYFIKDFSLHVYLINILKMYKSTTFVYSFYCDLECVPFCRMDKGIYSTSLFFMKNVIPFIKPFILYL